MRFGILRRARFPTSGIAKASSRSLSFLRLRALAPARLLRLGSFNTKLQPKAFSSAPYLETLASLKRITNDLITASSKNDIESIKTILAQGIEINAADYDDRTALHLAAAENHPEAVNFLLSFEEIDINKVDRWHFTPLHCALVEGYGDVCRILTSKGGKVDSSMHNVLVKKMQDACTSGDKELVALLLDCCPEISCWNDPDLRQPQHIAAQCGHTDVVKFLIERGFDFNCADRFGNTPLSLAQSVENSQELIEVLVAAGAKSSTISFSNLSAVTSAIKDAMPILAERTKVQFVEAFLPVAVPSAGDGVSRLELAKSDDYRPPFSNTEDDLSGIVDHNWVVSSKADDPFLKAWTTQQPVFVKNAHEEIGIGDQLTKLCAVLLPISSEGASHCILALYLPTETAENKEDARMLQRHLHQLGRFANRILSAGVFGNSRDPAFDPQKGVPRGQQSKIFKLLNHNGDFSPTIIYSEVDYYYKMGLDPTYFIQFDIKVLARHVQAFIAAKKFATTTGEAFRIWLTLGFDKPGEPAVMAVPNLPRTISAAERTLESKMRHIQEGYGIRLEYNLSSKPVVPSHPARLGFYILHANKYINPNAEVISPDKEFDILDYATEEFGKNKKTSTLDRYASIVEQAMHQLAPVTQVNVDERNSRKFHCMFATRQGKSLEMVNHLHLVTELLLQSGLTVQRKYIETFSNGVMVYSFHFLVDNDHTSSEPRALIDSVMNDITVLHLLPETRITSLFLGGDVPALHFAYMMLSSRFVYYFINQASGEFEALQAALAQDSLNLGRLRILQNKMKREAVSKQRMMDVLVSYPDIMKMLFEDFVKRSTTNWQQDGPVPENESVVAAIKRDSSNDLDATILTAIYNFNRSVLKTNLFKQSKSAISVRLDTTFMEGLDWPQRPFAVFFVLSNSFQGFHVRFREVSRGGIRMIQSRDKGAYMSNLASQFAENYGLAFTQNKKNKDIPEFGSKGTILLEQKRQTDPFLAFKTYVDGLLDLLVIKPEDAIVNNLVGDDELLFLGPDEGTANMMEWAAYYARTKGYLYWRAFTTGKPDNMGGIPHDTYGMTTSSVHRYVLGCLRKSGLEEKNCTKVQTGGPDGDLGSNEILMSEDKTISIIDGAGVVYDPAGLDRGELVRLATERVMCDHFDTSKLGPGGFFISVNDQNVTLPNGDSVESGVVFRNEFHLNKMLSADIFVPCGGRPNSITLSNVDQMFHEDGSPRFKFLVEGANLFCSDDARMVLEQRGVVLFKDASTNKGGVTSSSLEVLAALTLSEEEFATHMTVKGDTKPEFYQAYVKEVQERVMRDADHEFECIWREHQKSGVPNYLLTDHVSEKINELNDSISQSDMFEDEVVRRNVLSEALPKTLQHLVPMDTIMERVPNSYLRATFSCYLASRYIYTNGLSGNEFTFFGFMEPYGRVGDPSGDN